MIGRYLSRRRTLSDWWTDVTWNHPWINIVLFMGFMVAFLVVVFYISFTLTHDITKPGDVKKNYVFEVTAKKKNGLTTTITIESDKTIKVRRIDVSDVLIITEYGKNRLGVEIDNDTRIDNVIDYSLKTKYKK
jgi:hypothetical protein